MLALLQKFKRNKEPVVLRKKAKPRHLTPLQLQIGVGVILVVVITLCVTLIYYVTRIDSFQIKDVEVIGGQTISHTMIADVVNVDLGGFYLHLIPKRFSSLYPHDEILNRITAIDRVKNVQVSITKEHVLVVVFEEYTPYALWCEHGDSESCLFLDATGFAFAKAPILDGGAFVRYVEVGVVPQVKTNAFDGAYMKQTALFTEGLLEKLSLYVTRVTKVGNYDIEYTISGGAVIKVSQMLPMEKTFSNLESILHSEEFAHFDPGSFQYIDLRFGDKVFINESTLQTGTSTASSSVEQSQ